MDELTLDASSVIARIVHYEKQTNRMNNAKNAKTVKWGLCKIREYSKELGDISEPVTALFRHDRARLFRAYDTCCAMSGIYERVIESLYKLHRAYRISGKTALEEMTISEIRDSLTDTIAECHARVARIAWMMNMLVDTKGFQLRSERIHEKDKALVETLIDFEDLDSDEFKMDDDNQSVGENSE